MILQSDPSRPFIFRDASLARLLWDLSDRASYLEPNVEFYLDQFLVGRRVNGPVPDDPGWNQTYVAGSSRIRDLHGVVILPFDEDVQIGVVVLPILCVLATLLQRLWRGCCHSGAAVDDRSWSNELNEGKQTKEYTEEQRARDRREEAAIKSRVSRTSLSHV